jgi:pyridinium-3,5-bisthiocarboxylic acid mononucleotide nickel chelatase
VGVPVVMKKGRAGTRLEVLLEPDRLEAVLSALFRGTTTLGARYWPVKRPELARWEQTVSWRGQRIRRKAARLPDGVTRWKPEYEDIAAAARALGLTPQEVRAALDKDLSESEPAGPPGNEEQGGTG